MQGTVTPVFVGNSCGGTTWCRPRVLVVPSAALAQAYSGVGGGTLRRTLPVRPAHPLLTRLLGPNLTSLSRRILTAAESLRSLRLQDHGA